MKDYIFTDLICEESMARLRQPNRESEASSKKEWTVGNIKITKWSVNSEDSQQKERIYLTISTRKIWQLEDDDFFELRDCLAAELRQLMMTLLDAKTLDSRFSVMVVGLGNSEITPDAVGPETVKRITVTRHLFESGLPGFSLNSYLSVSAITPGVLANTGIETLEVIKGAVQNVRPDLLIAVDALAAKSCSRLASTVQLSNDGIFPGSGIGNYRKAINADTVGVPVIALGIPTVVNSSTLIVDALEQGGISEINESMRQLLENRRSFFVTPKETDLIVKSVSFLLASAIDRACGISEV